MKHDLYITYLTIRSKIILITIIMISSCFSAIAQEMDGLKSMFSLIEADYREFYARDNLIDLSIASASAVIMAHTAADRKLIVWHQNEIRSNYSDEISSIAKLFGEGKYLLPVAVLSASSGLFLNDNANLSCISTWGERTARAYLLGAPFTLLLQRSTGASRPGERSYHSEWRPFRDDNGVSGHAFIGAVPFLIAKDMIKNKYTTPIFYLLSGMTAWSRINDNKHYSSQAFLGWFIAFKAASVISKDQSFRKIGMIPIEDGFIANMYIHF
ncbi:phosphatase PAP2 family protein [candidate division KSB1 bacterium]|nr:phosphatase PAP2 family protein [candidate division KSB1 bacterium]